METTLYNQKGTKAGTVSVSAKVFGVKWNADLVHQVVVSMTANKRAGTAHTKDRSEVSGGGKKPWKQKGTGRARHGSTRSPIWVGGGVTFGPRNEKDYSKKINKKMRAKALFTVLSKRFADNQVLFVDNISLDAMKTKNATAVLKDLSTIKGFEKLGSKKATTALLALPKRDVAIEKSFANFPGVTVSVAKEMNALEVMHFTHIIMVDPKEILPSLEAKMA